MTNRFAPIVHRAGLLLVCATLGLGAAACGGDDEESSPAPEATGPVETETGPAEAPATGPDDAPAAGGKPVEVSMKDVKFVPKSLKVKAGTTVKWTNDDSFPHTVTKDEGPGREFDSGNVAGGDTYEQKFTATGKVGYVCTIHPGQNGSITVE